MSFSDMKFSSTIVADAVRKYWNEKGYPQDVVAYFYQKHDWEDCWHFQAELAMCEDSDDYDRVIFLNDFCEGETLVDELVIVPLDEILGYYYEEFFGGC